jgi:hypothetical protein
VRCEAVDYRDVEWDVVAVKTVGNWNGTAVQLINADERTNRIYQQARVESADVYLVDYYSSNEPSYSSFNDPSSCVPDNDYSSSSSSSSDYTPPNEAPTRNVVDLGRDVAEAYIAAREQNWVEAANKSLDVAQDVIDVGTDVVEAFVESRTDAVTGGYAENSDLGFQ